MCLILDETQIVDQREDGNIPPGQKSYIAAKWDKPAAHIELVYVFICNFAYGSEALKFFRFVVFEFRRIKNYPIPCVHALQRRGFAVVGLDKSTYQSALKMVFRGDNNPVMSSYFGSWNRIISLP